MNNVVKHIQTGYDPRPLQLYLHGALRRFNVIICHRRFGKTVFSINEMIDRGMRNQRKNPQYAYVAPTYGQAKRIAWDYLKEYTKNIPGVIVNESELRVDIPRPGMGDRVRFVLLGAENPNTIRGMYLDGVLLDEYAEMDPTIWTQVILPALSDRKGWAIFIGTPKGKNHLWDVYRDARAFMDQGSQDWFTTIYKASETGVISPEELELAREAMSAEEFEQEFECSFNAALVGAYYKEEMAQAEREGRVTNVPYDKHVPVCTYWDLGKSDSTSIWFVQYVGKEYHIIDYLEDNGKEIAFYCSEILKRPYLYAEHVLPHDAAAKILGMENTRQEQIENLLGRRNVRVLKRASVEDGIAAVRRILNMCWFDKTKCAQGVEALKSYEKKWDAKNKVYMSTPLHNWASHPADSFRQFAMGIQEPQTNEYRNSRPTRTKSSYSVFNRTGAKRGLVR